jgi:spore maturation protein CgeB
MRKDDGQREGRCQETWEKNLATLKARSEGLDRLPPVPGNPHSFHQVKFLAGEPPSLQVMGEEGRGVTLHSPRRAWQEAQELAQTAPVGGTRYLVALGLGLGYHLLSLLPLLSEDQYLIVVEKEAEVVWAALSVLDLTELLSRPRTMLVVSPEADEVVCHLQMRLPQGNGDGLAFWGHPPSLRSHKTFYQEVVAHLKPSRRSAIRPVGLKKDNLRVLVINPDYFLLPEVMRAFGQLGHEVRLALFDKRRDQGEEVLRQLLLDVREFSPDLVFTVNHLGFDREGLLLDTLHRLRVPSVSWYVDSPAIILSLYDGPQSDLAFIFVWDPTYIPEVRALGFDRVFPLPLATDPEVFSPKRAGSAGNRRTPVAFVGNSLVGSVQEKLARLPGSPKFQELFQKLSNSFQSHPFRRLEFLLAFEGLKENPFIRGLDRQGRSDLEAALLWRATLKYRLTCIRELVPFEPVIYGDAGWQELLGKGFILRPEVNYYDELPQVYGATDINFNATSLQMKAAVNQRVFDAPAAGGFLLTDFREQLAELFKVGDEVACFTEPGEIPELVRFYLRHPEVRKKVTAKARDRVLKEHTYRHRVAAMLDTMRRTL